MDIPDYMKKKLSLLDHARRVQEYPHGHKYQIGDIVYGKITNKHYLIEAIDFSFGNYGIGGGWRYFYRVIETGEIDSDLIKFADKARNFYKVG